MVDTLHRCGLILLLLGLMIAVPENAQQVTPKSPRGERENNERIGEKSAPVTVTIPKIHPRVRELTATQNGLIPVIIVEVDQPQADILARHEGANALRIQVAAGRLRQMREQPLAASEAIRQAEEDLNALELQVRQAAFDEIRPTIQPAQDLLESRLVSLGAQRIRRFQGVTMISAAIPAAAIGILEMDPSVAQVIPDETNRAHISTSVPALGAPTFWNNGRTGASQYVGVLDTGIATDHPAFSGTTMTSHISLYNGSQDTCFGDNNTSSYDQVGHGTHVAGIVASEGSSECENCQGVAKGLSGVLNLKIGLLSQKCD
jgi:subtilisin family serine protease